MPSFWNWLCFPRNHGVSGNNTRRRRRPKQNVVTLQKRKLLEDASHLKEEQTGDLKNSEINLKTDRNVPYKRRRVQDIFSNTEPVSSSADESVSITRVHPNNLAHTRVPNIFNNKEKTNKNSERIESMYGYVPKTMQNLYTSTALEGQKIEDYFSNLHNDIYFSKFANSEAAIKDSSAANVLQRFPFTRKTSAVFEQEEKVSLIESKEGEDEMDVGLQNDFNTWQNSISPRTDYDMEDNFKSIFDSREEVLY